MGQATRAAAQMVGHMRAHNRPAQPRPIHQRKVHRLHICDAFSDDMNRFAPECRGQPIGQMTHRLTFHPYRHPANATVNLFGAGQSCLRRAKQLNQGHEMGRVVGVSIQQTLRPVHLRAQF